MPHRAAHCKRVLHPSHFYPGPPLANALKTPIYRQSEENKMEHEQTPQPLPAHRRNRTAPA